MANKLPFMPFYGRDFYADEAVKGMTDQQQSWYLALLWHQWEHESLPDDPFVWYGTVRPGVAPDDPEWERFLPTIERLFPRGRDRRRRNKKNAEVREKHLGVRKAQSEGGKAGAEARWAQRDSQSVDGTPIESPNGPKMPTEMSELESTTELHKGKSPVKPIVENLSKRLRA